MVVEEPPDRIDHGVADLAQAPLALRAEVQVAVAHQEIDAVGLGRDGIALGRRDDPGVSHRQLIAADAAFVGADDSRDAQRRLLAHVLDPFEQLLGHVGLLDGTLTQAGSIPQDDELYLAAGPAVVDPAVQGDFLADMVFQLVDVHAGLTAHNSVSSHRWFVSADSLVCGSLKSAGLGDAFLHWQPIRQSGLPSPNAARLRLPHVVQGTIHHRPSGGKGELERSAVEEYSDRR